VPHPGPYQRLIALFDSTQTPCQLIDREPDGTGERSSPRPGQPRMLKMFQPAPMVTAGANTSGLRPVPR